MTSFFRTVRYALIGVLAVACSTGGTHFNSRYPGSVPQAGQKSFSIIALTDFHGALESETAGVGQNQEVTYGGAGTVATYVDRLRKKLGPCLLIDGGDMFQGTMLSNTFEGAPVIRFYNQLGVDAVALGNHEFDFGPIGPKAVPRAPKDDAQGALKQRIKEAKFPVLGANVRDANGNLPPWLKASVIKKINGVSVGIIGISDPQTPSTTNALNLVGLTFADPAEAIIREATRLKTEEKVEAVVVTAHMGAICNDNSLEKIEDLTSCKATNIFEVVKKLPEGMVDVVVAGHTHRNIIKRVNKTLIVQASSSGRYVGWVNVSLGQGENSLNQATFGGLAPVCLTVLKGEGFETCDPFELKEKVGIISPATFMEKEVVPDASITKLYDKEFKTIKKKKEQKVGRVVLDSEFTRSYAEESTLGNFVADLTKEMTKEVDLAITNGGGLRANLPAGQLIYDSVFKLAPFDNQFAIIKVTGKQIIQMANIGASGRHGAYVWSHNVSFDLLKCGEEPPKVEMVNVDGKPVEENKIYRLGLSDYLAGGGSGIRELNLQPKDIEIFWDREFILRDAMVRVLKTPAWNRNLTALEFYDSKSPRQKIKTCGP